MSKFSLDVLNKRVFPFVETNDPDVILGASFGEDVALTQVGGDILASHVDPIVGAIENIGWLAVHVACNDIATSGIPPRWILLLVLVPKQTDEDLLEHIMSDIKRGAEEVGVSIIGGHTGYSSGLRRPMVAVSAFGTASGRRPVYTNGACVGDQVLITKGVAMEGTAILAQDFEDVATELGMNKQDLEEARSLINEISVVKEALVLAKIGTSAMHDVTRGGLLETLLEIAHLSGVGIEVDTSRMLIRPIVTSFAQAFKFDPLKMISSGSLVATVHPKRMTEISRTLTKMGIPFANIGRVKKGKDVSLLLGDKVIRYHKIRCEEDELARMWTLYPRDK